MRNTFGHLFRCTTFGESHGTAVGVVIDGCPPRLALKAEDIQRQLDRRRPGQSKLTTARQEPDQVEILSGVYDGWTLGTPITLCVRNQDARSHDYKDLQDIFRPSHADYTYQAKFGIRAKHGGGRASARETLARVAAAAVADIVLQKMGIQVVAYVQQIEHLATTLDPTQITSAQVEAHPVRCPDEILAEKMQAQILEAQQDGDSLGGVITAVAHHVPTGLGEPVFDKLEAQLAHAILSIPACRGFEIGSGFAGTKMRGSTHNDAFVLREGKNGPRVGTSSNHAGGIQGGISNGEPIVVRAAFKPTATIAQAQQTLDQDLRSVQMRAAGRHDPCVLPRAVPIVEAMIKLVLVDQLLQHNAYRESYSEC